MMAQARILFVVPLLGLLMPFMASSSPTQNPYEYRFGIGEADRGGSINWGRKRSLMEYKLLIGNPTTLLLHVLCIEGPT